MSPPIFVFLTTIASQPALRHRQETLLRILQAKKIPFKSYDLASDPDAKRLWRRKAPVDKQQLPGILVGYRFVGTYAQFEEAVEFNELDQFLKLKEPWDPDIDEDPLRPPPEEKPIGVPGAQLPMQMTPDHIKKHIIAEQSSPLRIKSKTKPIPVNKEDDSKKLDLGSELSGFGLQGVKVTEDELKDLISQLGLGGEEADDLAKGLISTDEKKEDKRTSPLSKPPVMEDTKKENETREVKVTPDAEEVKEVAEEPESKAAETKGKGKETEKTEQLKA